MTVIQTENKSAIARRDLEDLIVALADHAGPAFEVTLTTAQKNNLNAARVRTARRGGGA